MFRAPCKPVSIQRSALVSKKTKNTPSLASVVNFPPRFFQNFSSIGILQSGHERAQQMAKVGIRTVTSEHIISRLEKYHFEAVLLHR